MKDDEILALLKAKKQEGLSCILDKYAGLMRYIIKNTGNVSEEDISECMSDILYTIWMRINKYDGRKASFKTWIMLVTRGCAIDYLRKNIRRGNVVSFDEIDEIYVADTDYTRISDGSVIAFLQELTPPDNEIFYRRFVLGESVDEISKVLEITKENVYKRLSRGKKQLKSLMSREGYHYA
jgi:RNA polymerase sigma-70 factor (ECF subfamily)